MVFGRLPRGRLPGGTGRVPGGPGRLPGARLGRLGLLAGGGGRFSLSKDIFGNGTYDGFYYDFTATTGLFQTTDTSSPVTSSGQSVGRVEDGSPNDRDATQGTAGARGTWNSGSYWLGDGTDDRIVSALTGDMTEITLVMTFRKAADGLFFGLTSNGTNQRCFLGALSGELVGGWGTQTGTTIKGGVAANDTEMVGLLRASATNIELWLNGVRVYGPAAPSGSASGNAAAFSIGQAGAGSFVAGRRMIRNLAVKRYVPDDLILPLMQHMARPGGAFAGITF